jgi:hypothetical protein
MGKKSERQRGKAQRGWYDRRVRQVRDLPCGPFRIALELEVRRVQAFTFEP